MVSSGNGKWHLGIFVIATALIFYLFVYNQWYLVASSAGFVTIVFIFVALSFFTSAIETAFSTAHTDKTIQVTLYKETSAIATRYVEFDELVRSALSIKEFNEVQRKRLAKLASEERAFRKTGKP